MNRFHTAKLFRNATLQQTTNTLAEIIHTVKKLCRFPDLTCNTVKSNNASGPYTRMISTQDTLVVLVQHGLHVNHLPRITCICTTDCAFLHIGHLQYNNDSACKS